MAGCCNRRSVSDVEMAEHGKAVQQTTEPTSETIGLRKISDELEGLVTPSGAKKASTIAPAEHDDVPRCMGLPMKWVSLVALTLQTTGQVLLIKWARAESGKAPYLSSTVVFFAEVVKTLASVFLVGVESRGMAIAFGSLREHFSNNKTEVLKAAVPALIYTFQNNLMFYSLEKLSAPVQQVLYQMKILTTAGMGVLMLGKKLTTTQWCSLFILTMGVTLVQWPRHTGSDNELLQQSNAEDLLGSIGGDQLKGFVAVLVACVTSGFAGVYIQKMMQQTTASIWMRNVQFGFFGSVMGLFVAMGQDGHQIATAGFTQGYSLRVVLVIAMNAFGGLLCAAMLKYAGATLGCFSTALSIILTCISSATLLEDFVPDELFLLGTCLAISSCLLYGLGLPQKVYKLIEDVSQLYEAPKL